MASSQSWWDECIADLRPMRPGWHRAVSNYQTGTKAEKPYPDLLKKYWSALTLSSRDGLITLGLERKAYWLRALTVCARHGGVWGFNAFSDLLGHRMHM